MQRENEKKLLEASNEREILTIAHKKVDARHEEESLRQKSSIEAEKLFLKTQFDQ